VSLFGNKTKEKSALVCIIESGGVRLGLALLRPRAKPLLMFQVIETVPLAEKPTAERLRALTLDAVARAGEKMVREGLAHSTVRSRRHGHIDELHFIYASPWHISQTKTVTIENEKPFRLTQKLIHDVVDRETRAMAEEYQATKDPSLTDISIIEERITNITLNGYPVENPYEKETPRATLTLFASIIEKNFRETVEETLARSIHARSVHHHSLPLTLFSGIRDSFAAGRDFAIAITGAEVTDIAYARMDALVDTGSFPIGRSTITRTLADTLGQTTKEAASLFNEKHLAHLDDTAKERATDGIMKATGGWVSAFRKELFDMLAGSGSPQTVFLVGGDEEHAIRLSLERERLGNATKVIELTGGALQPFCAVGGGIRIPDPRIVFGILFAHRLDV